MKKAIELLKTFADWLAGKAEELEQLDAKTRAAITKQTRRAFWIGFGSCAAVTAALRLLGVL